MALKHLPDCPLALDGATGQQLARRFERELLAKAQQPDTRLVVGCTIRPAAEGLGHVDTLAMMAVTPEWIPFDHLLERALLGELVRQRRRFLKPLAYEAGSSAAFASALLLDAGDVPVPLHVVTPSAVGQRRLLRRRRAAGAAKQGLDLAARRSVADARAAPAEPIRSSGRRSPRARVAGGREPGSERPRPTPLVGVGVKLRPPTRTKRDEDAYAPIIGTSASSDHRERTNRVHGRKPRRRTRRTCPAPQSTWQRA